ncbi:tetratricopeptide repeat protein [Clostridiaceae bacterium DONG20-135]|uniref:Tetratricopeptide repeat protein n=1 Tax=Copranaerobaculum intestinale TaxID=2692629 RepID=A0A6N8U8V3_9FIRM|nr:BTAD domain-containing putative transcriptional regulator [Copranaerobaculum intestinale]MXQ74280.1 tetratricopeptide repeat protein [Copranaerobaculum intestinale]
MEKGVMQVTLFQNFTMSYQGENIKINEAATKQLTILLEILFLNLNQPVPRDKLINYLWQDSDNPSNVLKFSIFRLRKMLSGIESLKDVEFVQTTKQGYLLNQNIPIKTDVQTVDELWKQINNKDARQETIIQCAQQIVDVYKGRLYVDAPDQLWLQELQNEYHNIFQSCISKISEYYLHMQDYHKVISVMQKAIAIDPYFEDAYYYYIQALIETNRYKEALDLYKNVQDQFYQSVGQPLSLKMKSLYKIIIANDEQEEINLKTLKTQLESDIDRSGAFYCDYEFFKHIYQVELRNIKRKCREQYLVVFEISTDLDDEPLRAIMTKLTKIIQNSLRMGDVYSRINKTQIVLLLPCETIDNGYAVIQRITQQFYRKVTRKQAKLHYHIEAVTTSDSK